MNFIMKAVNYTIIVGLCIAISCPLQAEVATAKVLELSGYTTIYNSDGAQRAAQVGDVLREGDGLSVDGELRLAFSTGSELAFEAGARLEITKLRQAPYVGSESYAQLEADPSVSDVEVSLYDGLATGHVKTLHPGSSFVLATELGRVDIKGTRFRVNTRFTGNPKDRRLEISNLSGSLDVISRVFEPSESNQGSMRKLVYDDNIAPRRLAVSSASQVVIYMQEEVFGNALPRVFTPDVNLGANATRVVLVSPSTPI